MQYRVNKKNGQSVSALAFGCMRFPKDEKLIDRLVGHAIEQGINYFDTAYIYPGNEAALGRALNRERRDKVNIATKLPPYFVKKEGDLDKLFRTHLERLNTDRIDYYLIHSLSELNEWTRLLNFGIIEWIEKKKASGEIGNIGFSYHGGVSEYKRIVDAYDWEFTMIQYNYLDEHRQAGKTGLSYAAEKGLPVMIMEPLMGGTLANGLPPKAAGLFEKLNRTPAEAALRWVWNHDEVLTVLSGMNTMEMLEENIKIASSAEVGCLSRDESVALDEAKRILLENISVPCTGCGYCMPCPKGVDIPLCFSAYNDRKLISPRRALASYLHRVDSHNASLCVKCGKCEEHCPQKIAIRDRLDDVVKTFERFPYKPLRYIMRKILKRDARKD